MRKPWVETIKEELEVTAELLTLDDLGGRRASSCQSSLRWFKKWADIIAELPSPVHIRQDEDFGLFFAAQK